MPPHPMGSCARSRAAPSPGLHPDPGASASPPGAAWAGSSLSWHDSHGNLQWSSAAGIGMFHLHPGSGHREPHPSLRMDRRPWIRRLWFPLLPAGHGGVSAWSVGNLPSPLGDSSGREELSFSHPRTRASIPIHRSQHDGGNHPFIPKPNLQHGPPRGSFPWSFPRQSPPNARNPWIWGLPDPGSIPKEPLEPWAAAPGLIRMELGVLQPMELLSSCVRAARSRSHAGYRDKIIPI